MLCSNTSLEIDLTLRLAQRDESSPNVRLTIRILDLPRIMVNEVDAVRDAVEVLCNDLRRERLVDRRLRHDFSKTIDQSRRLFICEAFSLAVEMLPFSIAETNAGDQRPKRQASMATSCCKIEDEEAKKNCVLLC